MRGKPGEYEWVDPDATGDDSLRRETCEANKSFMAEHEPTEMLCRTVDDLTVYDGNWIGPGQMADRLTDALLLSDVSIRSEIERLRELLDRICIGQIIGY